MSTRIPTHGGDTTKYRLSDADHVRRTSFREAGPRRRAEGAHGPRARGHARRLVPPAAEAPAAGRVDPRRSRALRRTTGSWRRRSSGTPSSRRSSSCPFCQDTGTATVVAWKGQQVWTGANDAEKISKGIWQTYTQENLRYSQTAALNMYDEVNTGNNLPAQIDIYATKGDAYKFLFVAKGGGSANKTYLFQETKALLNPASLEAFLVEKMKTLGTAACPPYHIVFVVGGTSAEACLKTVKLASTGYYDAFRRPGTSPAARSATPSSRRSCSRGRRARLRRAVRRQVLRPRRPRHPPAAARRVLPGRHGRLVLGRPQRPREDRREGALARGARAPPRDAPPRRDWRRRSTRASCGST